MSPGHSGRRQNDAVCDDAAPVSMTCSTHPAGPCSLVGRRLLISLGAAAAVAGISLSPGSAQAYVVTVGGVQYDVTTFTGSYTANSSKFNTAANGGVMPWFGSSSLALSFATAVGTNLGTPNSFIGNTSGPAFSYQTTPTDTFGKAWCTASCFLSGDDSAWSAGNSSVVYAQVAVYTAPVQPAPGPLPLFGAAAAFGFSRKLRTRIQGSRQPLGAGRPRG